VGAVVTYRIHVYMGPGVQEGVGVPNTATVASGGTYNPPTNDSSTWTVYTKFFGLIGIDSVSIGATKAVTDGFDSSTGNFVTGGKQVDILSNGPITVAGTVKGSIRSTHGNITVQSGSTVTGDVFAGGTITAPAGTIQGTRYPGQVTSSIAADVVACPNAPTYRSATDLRALLGNTATYTYSASTGDITISGNGNVVTFPNGAYCFHNFTVSGGASVRVTSGSLVKLYISGILSASGGSFSNLSNIPAELEIFSSYTQSNGVYISGGSKSYLTVYAPQTDVTISGGSPLFGAVLGRTLTSTGNALLHIDLNIPGGPTGWAPGLHTVAV
jgi:hypothetical protein